MRLEILKKFRDKFVSLFLTLCFVLPAFSISNVSAKEKSSLNDEILPKGVFFERWIRYPGKKIETSKGLEYSTKFERFLLHKNQLVPIGVLTYTEIPNLVGNSFSPKTLANEYAQLLEVPRFIVSRLDSKKNLIVYNSYWKKMNRIVRLFVRTEKDKIRFAFAFYRMAYAKQLNVETELIGNMLLSTKKELVSKQLKATDKTSWLKKILNKVLAEAYAQPTDGSLLGLLSPTTGGGSGDIEFDLSMKALIGLGAIDTDSINSATAELSKAAKNLQNIDTDNINKTVSVAQKGFENFSNLDIDGINKGVQNTFKNTNGLLTTLDGKVKQFDVDAVNDMVANGNSLILSAKNQIEKIDIDNLNSTVTEYKDLASDARNVVNSFNIDGVNNIVGNIESLTGAISPEMIEKIVSNAEDITSNISGITGNVNIVSGTIAKLLSSPKNAALTFASAIAIKSLTQGVVGLALNGIVKGIGALIKKLSNPGLSLEEKRKLFLQAMSKYETHMGKIAKLESELDKSISFFEGNDLSFEELLAITDAYSKNATLSKLILTKLDSRIKSRFDLSIDPSEKEYNACALNQVQALDTKLQDKIDFFEKIKMSLSFQGLTFNGMKGKDALCGYFNHILDSIFFLEYQISDLREVMVVNAPEYINSTIARSNANDEEYGKQLDELVSSYVASERESMKDNALYVMDNVKRFNEECPDIAGCDIVQEEAVNSFRGTLLLVKENPFLTESSYREGVNAFLGGEFSYKNLKNKNFKQNALDEIIELEKFSAVKVDKIESDFMNMSEKIKNNQDLDNSQRIALLNKLISLKNVYIFNIEQQIKERKITIQGIVHYANYRSDLKDKPKRKDYNLSGKEIKEMANLTNKKELTKREIRENKETKKVLSLEDQFINTEWRKKHKERVQSNDIGNPSVANAHIARVKGFINQVNCGFELQDHEKNAACKNSGFSQSKRFQDLMKKQNMIEKACRKKGVSAADASKNIEQRKSDRLLSLESVKDQIENEEIDKTAQELDISLFGN